MIGFGVFARIYPHADLGRVVEAAARDGFAYLHASPELLGLEDAPGEVTTRRVREALAGSGMALFSVSGTFNAIHPDEDLRRRETRRLATMIPFVAELGCDVVTLNTGTRDPEDKWRAHPDNTSRAAWTDLLRTLEDLVPAAEANEVRLGIEPEGGNVVRDADDVLRLFAEVGSGCLGVMLDAANLLTVQTAADQHRIIGRTIDLVGDRIIGAHAKDLAERGPAHPGSGLIDWPWLLRRLSDRSPAHILPVILQDVSLDALPRVRAHLEGCLP